MCEFGYSNKQPDRRGAVEIFLHGRARDPHAARHRCIAQPQPLFEPKHFLDPPHRHLRSWHLPAPPKRGDGSRHYLPLSSEARADQGCRKRRYQVPDWSEIRCRFPPKSPAAFDRNQVPLSAEITCRFRPKSGAGLLRFLQSIKQPFAHIPTGTTANKGFNIDDEVNGRLVEPAVALTAIGAE